MSEKPAPSTNVPRDPDSPKKYAPQLGGNPLHKPNNQPPIPSKNPEKDQ